MWVFNSLNSPAFGSSNGGGIHCYIRFIPKPTSCLIVLTAYEEIVLVLEIRLVSALIVNQSISNSAINDYFPELVVL